MRLTEIAGKTIESYFNKKNFKLDTSTKKKYSGKKGCFVTIYSSDGNLRGCIGCLFSDKPLWKSVQENSISSAFKDPRFFPLSKKELKDIKIEVSVLTTPKKLFFKNKGELLNKINKKMGLILKQGFNSATFLPQVWKQIPNKISFLEHLTEKAGLEKNSWQDSNTQLWFYQVYSEKD